MERSSDTWKRHLLRCPKGLWKRCLRAKSSDTPLTDPAGQLRKLIELELADSASDLSSDSSLDCGSTPRSVLRPLNPSEHSFSPQEPHSFSGPLPRPANELKGISSSQTPPKPLRPRRPYNPLQLNLQQTLQPNPKPLQLDSEALSKSGKPLQSNPKALPSASRLVPVRQLAITPLRAYLAGPYMELGNKVLRRRPDLTDRFLRVFFTEEDLGHLGNGEFEQAYIEVTL